MKKNILIVEDNPFMQSVAKKMVEKLGYKTAIASTGAEALQMTTQEHYEVILLDCQIPIINGYEVAIEVRNREKKGIKTEKSNIIACTANSLEGDKERCLNSGMNDYMTKPILEDVLKSKLIQWS